MFVKPSPVSVLIHLRHAPKLTVLDSSSPSSAMRAELQRLCRSPTYFRIPAQPNPSHPAIVTHKQDVICDECLEEIDCIWPCELACVLNVPEAFAGKVCEICLEYFGCEGCRFMCPSPDTDSPTVYPTPAPSVEPSFVPTHDPSYAPTATPAKVALDPARFAQP